MIPLSELRRIERALQRFDEKVEQAYPGLSATMGEWSNPATETIRNAGSALAEISGWINHRKNHRRDPELPCTGQALNTSGDREKGKVS